MNAIDLVPISMLPQQAVRPENTGAAALAPTPAQIVPDAQTPQAPPPADEVSPPGQDLPERPEDVFSTVLRVAEQLPPEHPASLVNLQSALGPVTLPIQMPDATAAKLQDIVEAQVQPQRADVANNAAFSPEAILRQAVAGATRTNLPEPILQFLTRAIQALAPAPTPATQPVTQMPGPVNPASDTYEAAPSASPSVQSASAEFAQATPAQAATSLETFIYGEMLQASIQEPQEQPQTNVPQEQRSSPQQTPTALNNSAPQIPAQTNANAPQGSATQVNNAAQPNQALAPRELTSQAQATATLTAQVVREKVDLQSQGAAAPLITQPEVAEVHAPDPAQSVSSQTEHDNFRPQLGAPPREVTSTIINTAPRTDQALPAQSDAILRSQGADVIQTQGEAAQLVEALAEQLPALAQAQEAPPEAHIEASLGAEQHATAQPQAARTPDFTPQSATQFKNAETPDKLTPAQNNPTLSNTNAPRSTQSALQNNIPTPGQNPLRAEAPATLQSGTQALSDRNVIGATSAFNIRNDVATGMTDRNNAISAATSPANSISANAAQPNAAPANVQQWTGIVPLDMGGKLVPAQLRLEWAKDDRVNPDGKRGAPDAQPKSKPLAVSVNLVSETLGRVELRLAWLPSELAGLITIEKPEYLDAAQAKLTGLEARLESAGFANPKMRAVVSAHAGAAT